MYCMEEAGQVLHVAGSGRLIIRLTNRVDEGHTLCNRKGARIARVMELIGPASRPYASARSLTNNTRGIAGRKLFLIDTKGDKKR